MGNPTGFLEIERSDENRRAVVERVQDYHEFITPWHDDELSRQGARCMDCGVPTCHGDPGGDHGCPLGNLIPDWNDLVYRGDWQAALNELQRTNNFPEVTGRVCPAPCEDSCILGLNEAPVSIKAIERAIADHGLLNRLALKPQRPWRRSWKRVAIVGSGPAGLAAAQQLCRLGHLVTVFEKDDRFGGLLTYGIPDFKMEKRIVDQRIAQMRDEGVTFVPNTEVGSQALPASELLTRFDAILLAGGAQAARQLGPEVAGHQLDGIHPAMDFLTQQNRRVASLPPHPTEASPILAGAKRVLVLGGGDTGSDCIGTAHRQGAHEVYNYELLPKPPKVRTSSSHQEGGERRWGVLTKAFESDAQGRVQALHAVEVEWRAVAAGQPQMHEIPGSAFSHPVDLVLLALGFSGPHWEGLLHDLKLRPSARGTVAHDRRYMTNLPGVFTAGDMTRGASLVVWAIWEGREAARHMDAFLKNS